MRARTGSGGESLVSLRRVIPERAARAFDSRWLGGGAVILGVAMVIYGLVRTVPLALATLP